MSVYHYQRLFIRDGGDDATVRVRAAAASSIEAYAEVVPRARRQEAAQQLAGGDYVVVPAEQATWACARCYGAPQTHAGGGANDECLYEPILLINKAPQPDASAPDAAAMQDDLHIILHALGLSTAARASSPHEVVQREVVPAIWRLRAQAVQAGRPAYPYPDGDALVLGPETLIDRDRATICHKGENYTQQPDRPEPIDPESVRVGDIVEIEADGPVHSGPVLRASPSDFIVGLPTTSHNGVAYWHDELRKEATVRILHRPEPEPDEAAVEALEIALTYSMGDESDEYLHSVAVDLARRNVRVVPDA